MARESRMTMSPYRCRSKRQSRGKGVRAGKSGGRGRGRSSRRRNRTNYRRLLHVRLCEANPCTCDECSGERGVLADLSNLLEGGRQLCLEVFQAAGLPSESTKNQLATHRPKLIKTVSFA